MPRKREIPHEPAFFDIRSVDPQCFAEHYEEIVEAVEALPPEYREVIEAQFWERLSERNLAERLCVTRAIVRYRKRIALGMLKEVLKKCVLTEKS